MNLVDLQMLDRRQPDEIGLPPDGNSLQFLQACYRNYALPLHTRMRAAMAALKHEVPALLATAIVNENSFAELLDRRLKRMEQQTKQIEAKPINEPIANGGEPISGGGGGPPVDAKPPLPRIADRRFRRL